MGEGIQVYVNVDDSGEIISAQIGQYMVPTEEWDFYFYQSKEVADNIENYKVTVEGLRKKLILK